MMGWLLAASEAVIVVGSYVEARVRQREWFYRWAWWHLVALWFGWSGAVRIGLAVLRPALHREARRAVARYWRDEHAKQDRLGLPKIRP